MPLRERAALGVLAREPDRDAVDEQRGERERLGLAPVDPAFVERGPAPLELARELRVDGEALRYAQELVGEAAQAFGGDGGLGSAPTANGITPSCSFFLASPNDAFRRSCASRSSASTSAT